jgi:hypothetical protein
VEDSHSIGVEATPANGTYRPNPPLGAGTVRVVRASLERASGGMAVESDLQGRLSLETGDGDGEGGDAYFRAAAEGRWLTGAGPGRLLTRAYAGAGTSGLPAYRSFVLGGRGTLLGEPFRAYGGRSMAVAQTEWRLEVPVPALPLGSFTSTGRHLILAPFLAADVGASLAIVPCDITDAGAVGALGRAHAIDSVVHLAAQLGTDDPAADFERACASLVGVRRPHDEHRNEQRRPRSSDHLIPSSRRV